jgi:hypothetical protein
MSLESSTCLPSEAGQLVCIVTDPEASAERRSQAMARLLPQIIAIARRVAAGRPRRERDDLLSEAGSIIWERLRRFHQSKGTFDAWCSVVLYHQAIDRWRDAYGDGNETPPDDLPDDRDDNACTTEDELARLAELRSTLDRIAWMPQSPAGVHYFAVLLLQLRLAIARQWSSKVSEATASSAVDLVGLLEWLAPWRGPESGARIKPGWPPLTAVWSTLSADLEQPPYSIEPAALCIRVQPVLDGANRLTPDVWNHWVKRAKEAARRRLADDDVWDWCFRPLLPDR